MPDVEFKTMVIRMLMDQRGRIDDLSKKLNKNIVKIEKDIDTKKNQATIKNKISEIKNTLEDIVFKMEKIALAG